MAPVRRALPIAFVALTLGAVAVWLALPSDGPSRPKGDAETPIGDASGVSTRAVSEGGRSRESEPDPARENTLDAGRVSFRVSVVDARGAAIDNAVVVPAGDAVIEQTGGVTAVSGRLPVTFHAFASGFAGSILSTVDKKPDADLVLRLTREVTFPVKVFLEDGKPPSAMTGYFYFEAGQARGYARVDLDSRGENAAVVGPEGSVRLGFASDLYEGPAVERDVQDKTLLSIAVRPRAAGTLRVKCEDPDLAPPKVTFPLLPAAISAGNALAPHALRQATKFEDGWHVYENVAAGSVNVFARDGAETKEVRGFVVVAAGKTVDFVLR